MDQAVKLPSVSRSPVRSQQLIWLPRLAVLALVAVIVFYAWEFGLQFRHWMWDTTVPIRFISDIDRGYHWGRASATEGYLNQYEKMRVQQPADANWLDYGPLRLGVMALWGKWSIAHYPKIKAWHQAHSYELTAPVLQFNLFMEVVGVISAFFLARLWAIRGNPPPADPDSLRTFFRGCIPGLTAALLLWFNPAIVLSAYGWPTWDLWIVPVFILAALLASLDWWFTAGLVIGIGAMFKGQQLLAVPLFIVWSFILLRPLRSLKFAGGVVFAIAVVTSGWLLTYIPADQLAHAREIQSQYGEAFEAPVDTFKLTRTLDVPALTWVVGVLLCTAVLPWLRWIRVKKWVADPSLLKPLDSTWFRRTMAALVAFAAFACFVWPWLLERNRSQWTIGYPAAAALAISILLIRPRGVASLAATATGAALLLCMSVFHGSSAWYDCGIHFGTIHWPTMFVGMTDNLPSILTGDFAWPNYYGSLDLTAFTIPAHLFFSYPDQAIDVTTKAFLQSLFIITYVPCIIGVGLHARRRDARILIALTAPWLMFFCFPAQIHERYLLFAAGISCICAGVSAGMTLLGVLLTLVTFIMTLHVMLVSTPPWLRSKLGQNLSEQFPSLFNPDADQKLLTFAYGTFPHLGYAVILCGVIFLYFSVAQRWSSQRREVDRKRPRLWARRSSTSDLNVRSPVRNSSSTIGETPAPAAMSITDNGLE